MEDSMNLIKYQYAAVAALMILGTGTAGAQRAARDDDRADDFAQSVSYATYLKGKDLRASELVGARVRNAEGDSLGEIEELVIPTGDQDDMLVIVSVGGVADIGDKLVALPYKELRVSPDGDTFYYNRTEEQLKAAPAFSYGSQAEAQARAPSQTARVAPPAPAARDTQPAPAATARTTTDRPRATTPSAATAAKSDNLVLDVFDYRASNLIGAAVLDDRGEHVAKVDDIVVSTEDDKLHAVLAIGGFAGFGERLISIPFDELQITAAGNDPQVRIKMTGEALEQLAESRQPFNYERQVAKAPGNAPRG
jgi:sporulation protein YlmC with PRC-barrel domain